MTDASAKDARTAWFIGGGLLTACALFPLATQGLFVPGIGFVSAALWAASLFVFALGVRGRGSVVARRPLGVTALLVAALLPVTGTVVWSIVPALPQGSWPIPIGDAMQIALIAALVVATVQIARAGVVPAKVRWMPLIVLVAATAMQAIVVAVALNSSSVGPAALPLVYTAGVIAVAAAQLVLGIAALVLAPQLETVTPPAPVQVYPPAPQESTGG